MTSKSPILPTGAQAAAMLAALPSPLGVIELLEPLALPVYRGRMAASSEPVAVKVVTHRIAKPSPFNCSLSQCLSSA